MQLQNIVNQRKIDLKIQNAIKINRNFKWERGQWSNKSNKDLEILF